MCTMSLLLSLCAALPVGCTGRGFQPPRGDFTVPKSQKPAITRALGHFLLDDAGQCRTSNHSHSIVAGGLLDTS